MCQRTDAKKKDSWNFSKKIVDLFFEEFHLTSFIRFKLLIDETLQELEQKTNCNSYIIRGTKVHSKFGHLQNPQKNGPCKIFYEGQFAK